MTDNSLGFNYKPENDTCIPMLTYMKVNGRNRKSHTHYYKNMPMQYTEIFEPSENEIFQWKKKSSKKKSKNKKHEINIPLCIPVVTIRVALKGVFIIWTLYLCKIV